MRAEELAKKFAESCREFATAVEGLSDADWKKVTHLSDADWKKVTHLSDADWKKVTHLGSIRATTGAK